MPIKIRGDSWSTQHLSAENQKEGDKFFSMKY